MPAELVRLEHQGAAPATGLASGMGPADPTFTLLSGTGYPTGAGGKLFVIAVDPGTPSEEKILCSARSGVTVTVNTSGAGGRGFDGTTAASHATGLTNVQHVASALEIDDANRHIYTTTDDDHSQYARTDGTRAFTGGVTVNTGGAAITGNSTVTGTLTSSGLLTASGGIAATGNITATGTITPAAHRARYYVGIAGTVPGPSLTLFKYPTQDYDPNSLYSASTGLFTCPAAGYYRVYAQYGMQTPGTGHIVFIAVYHNGTAHATSQIAGQPGTINTYVSVSDVILCSATDTLAIYNSTDGTSNFYSYVSTISDTFVTFERVG